MIQISRWICWASEVLMGCKGHLKHVRQYCALLMESSWMHRRGFRKKQGHEMEWSRVLFHLPGENTPSCLTLAKPLISLLLLWPSKCSKSLPTACTYRIHPWNLESLSSRMSLLPRVHNIRNSTLYFSLWPLTFSWYLKPLWRNVSWTKQLSVLL